MSGGALLWRCGSAGPRAGVGCRSGAPHVTQKRYPGGFCPSQTSHTPSRSSSTSISASTSASSSPPGPPSFSDAIGGPNEKMGASARPRLASEARGGIGVALGEAGFAVAPAAAGAERSILSILGRPFGGVGATPRGSSPVSFRPQSWQKVRSSAFLRPQTSQITTREGTAKRVLRQGLKAPSRGARSAAPDLGPDLE